LDPNDLIALQFRRLSLGQPSKLIYVSLNLYRLLSLVFGGNLLIAGLLQVWPNMDYFIVRLGLKTVSNLQKKSFLIGIKIVWLWKVTF